MKEKPILITVEYNPADGAMKPVDLEIELLKQLIKLGGNDIYVYKCWYGKRYKIVQSERYDLIRKISNALGDILNKMEEWKFKYFVEFVCRKIKKHPYLYVFLPKILRLNDEVAETAVERRPSLLEYLPDEMRKEEILCSSTLIVLCLKHKDVFQFIPHQIRKKALTMQGVSAKNVTKLCEIPYVPCSIYDEKQGD